MTLLIQKYGMHWFGARSARLILLAFLAVAAMVAAGFAGAWIQARQAARHGDASGRASVTQRQMLGKQVLREKMYLRQNVALLADKVGTLQARLIVLDDLAGRVAKAADIQYTNPEIHASFQQASARARQLPEGAESAQVLGDRIATLQAQVANQSDRFKMLDMVLTRRAGAQARLPTLLPVHYTYMSSPFGWRRNPVTGRHSMHDGIDLAAPKGTPIKAASGGIVVKAGRETGYGKMVEISHGNGLDTLYAHASRLKVKVGQLVTKGQVIALVGQTGRATGPHLHFEVRMAGHPLDPTLFLHKSSAHQVMASVSSGSSDKG